MGTVMRQFVMFIIPAVMVAVQLVGLVESSKKSDEEGSGMMDDNEEEEEANVTGEQENKNEITSNEKVTEKPPGDGYSVVSLASAISVSVFGAFFRLKFCVFDS